MVIPIPVVTPTTLSSSTRRPVHMSCQKSTFLFDSSNKRHSSAKRIRSLCTRGDHMAGPFDMLSILNCMALLSVTIPDPPPKASISRII